MDKPLRILFYIPEMTLSNGGIYHYSISLLTELLENNRNETFYIYTKIQNIEIDQLCNSYKNVKTVNLPHETKFYYRISRLLNLSNKLFFKKQLKNKYTLSFLDYFIIKNKIDIIHSPFQDLPDTSTDVKKIVTIHDVQELHYPVFFNSSERAYRAVFYKKFIDSTDIVIVSYNHIKRDINMFFEKPLNQIEVCPISLRQHWLGQINLKAQELTNRVNGDYILYPAASWPHKNHLGLIKIFNQLLISSSGIKLIFTGHTNEFYNEILNYIKGLSLTDRVVHLGIVDNQTLYALYKNAKAVVIPTLYEAGSYPLMESILLEVPVICSNVTSLPETIGNDDFVFNPKDEDDFFDKCFRIVNDKDYIERNKANLVRQKQILLENEISNIIFNQYRQLKK